MSKTELLEQKEKAGAKPGGYVLTEKGLRAARRGQVSSMDDGILKLMLVSASTPMAKDSFAPEFWTRVSESMARLEEQGLVEKAGADGKAKVVMGKAVKPSKLELPAIRQDRLPKLTRDVYGDRRGERIARKKRPGWKKVKY